VVGIPLTIPQPLQADFTHEADLLKVSFTDQSVCTGCTVSSWAWEFGDGKSSAEQHPVHVYAQEGSYTVKLTVTNDKGQTDTVSKAVKVSKTLSYCAAASGNAGYEWIAKVTAGGFAKSSGASTYSDFTADAIPAAWGAAVSLTLTPGFAGGKYAEYWRVWADLNQDGDLEDAGEKLFEGSSADPLSGSFTLPATAKEGPTRLRVAMSYGSYANPCGTFSYGEVEDYTLNIGGGAPNYCAAQGESQGYEWIKQVAVGGFTKASKANKYSDFTAEKIPVTRGQAVAVTLTPGFRFPAVKYPESWRVWADLNRDGDFEDAGELLVQGSSENPLTGTITLPATVAAGLTRLRVSMSYGSYPNSCGSAEYGEVEDYGLDVK
jgi:hypothetical protein